MFKTTSQRILSAISKGFTKGISLEKDIWHGYIKDYDGRILVEYKIDPKLPYTYLSAMIHSQMQAIDEKIRELSNCHIVSPGINLQKEDGVPKKVVKVDDIPGLREAGWTPDQYGHSRFKHAIASGDGASFQKSLTAFMHSLLKTMHDHPDAWPFNEPVDARDVPDYYDIIKNPIADVQRMFDNVRTYNSPETIYHKCSTSLSGYKVLPHTLKLKEPRFPSTSPWKFYYAESNICEYGSKGQHQLYDIFSDASESVKLKLGSYGGVLYGPNGVIMDTFADILIHTKVTYLLELEGFITTCEKALRKNPEIRAIVGGLDNLFAYYYMCGGLKLKPDDVNYARLKPLIDRFQLLLKSVDYLKIIKQDRFHPGIKLAHKLARSILPK